MKLTDEQIGAELRSLKPMLEPRFAAELDERAAAGFAGEGGRSALGRLGERLTAQPLRRIAPALAAAAMAVVVATVVVTELGSDSGTESVKQHDGALSTEAAPSAQGGAAPSESVLPAKPSTGTIEPLPPIDQDIAPGAAKRHVERTATMTLSAAAGEVADVADGVVEVTDRYHGIVVSSSVQTTDDARSRATFDLRIPTTRLQAALADLSELAHVSSRNEGSLDITAPVISAKDRVADARAEIEGLLEQLANAGSTDESAALRERLRAARDELASVRAELRSLSQRADFTAVNVTVRGDGGGDGGGWSLGDAAGDALSVLKTTAGIALVSLAVLVPLALLATLAWLGWGAVTKRRREAALD
jgi:hypothetical protein